MQRYVGSNGENDPHDHAGEHCEDAPPNISLRIRFVHSWLALFSTAQ